MQNLILTTLLFLLTPFVTTQAAEETKFENLFSVVIAEWDGDGSMDKAVLAKSNDDDAALYIYLSNNNGKVIKKRNLVWYGAMWGTFPKLSINKSGSLIVHSMNDSIGRNRWSQKLTISYRKKRFIVSGYSYTSYDTLRRNSRSECDANLLTGKGMKNGKPFRFKTRTRPLKTWTDEQIPKQCA